jgi:hypothetical protein
MAHAKAEAPLALGDEDLYAGTVSTAALNAHLSSIDRFDNQQTKEAS